MHGTITSAPEVTNISRHGFWLLLGDEELLLPFEQFPWFRSATVEQISQNQLPVEWSPELVADGDRQQFFEHVINEYREG